MFQDEGYKRNCDSQEQQNENAVEMFQFQRGHSGTKRTNDALLVASTVSAVPVVDEAVLPHLHESDLNECLVSTQGLEYT